MKLKINNSKARHPGGRPPPMPFGHRGRSSYGVGLTSWAFDEPTVQTATEELGLRFNLRSRYRSLLVPVDGTPFGEHALPFALAIAHQAGAKVRVVHVHCPMQSVMPGALEYSSSLDASLERRRQVYLDDLVGRLKSISTVPVLPLFLQGREVADALLNAVSDGTDLVVMATHARGPLGRFWYGSVADVLMRRLSVPVLVVRGENEPADLTSEPHMRRILIPLDGSEFAEQVIEPAMELGILMDADHTLLRVIPWEAEDSIGYPVRTHYRSRVNRQWLEAREYLRRMKDCWGSRANQVHTWIVHDEQPVARTILHYARNHGTDLIAMATRGHGGLTRLWQGSVASQVIRGASMPVLVYRPDDQQ